MSDATLRSIHEATLERHVQAVCKCCCDGCTSEWPCADYEGAVAALKILDEADHWYPVADHRRATLADPDDLSDQAYVHVVDPEQVVPPAATDEKEQNDG